jgi:diguanylate cyclase (GGDEF)-like protein
VKTKPFIPILKKALYFLALLLTHTSVWSIEESALNDITPSPAGLKINHSFINETNINEEALEEIDNQVLKLLQEKDLLAARQLINRAIDNTDFSQHPRKLVNRILIRATLDRDVGANIAALQDLQFAFRLSASTNQQDLVADVAYTIASIHQSRNEHSIALSYIQQALNKYKQQGASKQTARSLLLGISSLLATRQLEQANDYLSQVQAYIEQSNDLTDKARYFQYLAESQLYSKNVKESIETLNIALKLVPETSHSQSATLHLLLSQAYTSKDNMNLAIDHLVKAFGIANNTESSFYLNQALQLHRANLLGQLNEFEAAFKVTQTVLKDRDLHQPVAEIKRMLDMHANFQLELQQQENASLKYENQWKSTQIESKQMLNKLYFLVIGLLFCISSLLLLLFLRGRKHRIHLENVAHTDALTGLLSRSRVLELLTHHQDLYARSMQVYCLAIIDLDYFKNINDTYGHVTGDKVLQQFGEICKISYRKSDIVGRIGGEEFLILLPNTEVNEALQVFEQFNNKLTSIGQGLELSMETTASIGLVTPNPHEAPMDIIKRADKALYEAKEQGRNRVVLGNK